MSTTLVTRSAVLARIRRAARDIGERLCVSRGLYKVDHRDFHFVSDQNVVVGSWDWSELEHAARHYGVLRHDETIAPD